MKSKPIVLAVCGINFFVAGCQSSNRSGSAQATSERQRHRDDAVARPEASAKPSEPEHSKNPDLSADTAAHEYSERVETLRRLMQLAASEGKPAEAVELLTSLLDEIEACEGREVSKQVAFSEACNFERQRHHHAARDAFALFTTRFSGDVAVAEAMLRRGTCLIELNEHGPAEAALREVIAEYPDSRSAEQAWRKLALAQLLASRYDEAIKTLDEMDRRYAGTHLSEYARVRKGYVMVIANRLDDGKAQYSRFLKECSGSKYCRLAKRELTALTTRSAETR